MSKKTTVKFPQLSNQALTEMVAQKHNNAKNAERARQELEKRGAL